MISGSLVALVTPFRGDELDEDARQNMVRWHIEQGTHGIVPVGTTGESATLTEQEHCRVIELVVQAADGRIPIIAGAGSNNTRECVSVCSLRESFPTCRVRTAPLLPTTQPVGMVVFQSPQTSRLHFAQKCRQPVVTVISKWR